MSRHVSKHAEMTAQLAIEKLGWAPAKLVLAQTFYDRLLGIHALPVPSISGPSFVLVFPCCSSVHTCFVKTPLDIAFVDTAGHILALYQSVPTARFLWCKKAFLVLERVSCSKSQYDKNLPKPFASAHIPHSCTASFSAIIDKFKTTRWDAI